LQTPAGINAREPTLDRRTLTTTIATRNRSVKPPLPASTSQVPSASTRTQEFLGAAAANAAALGISIAVTGLIAGVAVSIPAFRAPRVDPLTALRAD